MVIMQLGIFYDYWGDFSDNAWPVHIHYWTATLWYLFLIIQPYFATHGQMARHRTYGIIGMFLAGGVAMTALASLNRDMVSAERSAQSPDQFGPFEPWFFYGVAVIEFVMMAAFIVAVIQAIRHRKSLADHSWWLLSTVFIIMMPSLGRGLIFVDAAILGRTGPEVATQPIYATSAIIILLILWAARRYGRINHPATWLAIGVNILNVAVEPIGRTPWIQHALQAIVKA